MTPEPLCCDLGELNSVSAVGSTPLCSIRGKTEDALQRADGRSNNSVIGVQDPKKTMDGVEELPKGVVEEYKSNRNSSLKRPLELASFALAKKIKGYPSASSHKEELEIRVPVTSKIRSNIDLIEFVKPTHSVNDNKEESEKNQSDATKVATLTQKNKSKADLKALQPLSSENVGYQMLIRMGWKEAGLGKQEQGIQEPICVENLKKGIGLGYQVKENNPKNARKIKQKRKKNCAAAEKPNFYQAFVASLKLLGNAQGESKINLQKDFEGLIIFERYQSEDSSEDLHSSSLATLLESLRQFEPKSRPSYWFTKYTDESLICEIEWERQIISSGIGESQFDAKLKAATKFLDSVQQYCFTIKEKSVEKCEVVHKDCFASNGEYFVEIQMEEDNISQKSLTKNELFKRFKDVMRNYATSGSKNGLNFSRHAKDLQEKQFLGLLLNLAKEYQFEAKIKRKDGKLEQFTLTKRSPCLYLLLKKLKKCGGEDENYLLIPPKTDDDHLPPSVEGSSNNLTDGVVMDCLNPSLSERNIKNTIAEKAVIDKKMTKEVQGTCLKGHQVNIMAADFPTTILTTQQMYLVEEAIIDRILKNKERNVKPKYEHSCHLMGYLTITCHDVETAEWTKKQVIDLKPWEDSDLRAQYVDCSNQVSMDVDSELETDKMISKQITTPMEMLSEFEKINGTSDSSVILRAEKKRKKKLSAADRKAACKARLEAKGILWNPELYGKKKKLALAGQESVTNISSSLDADTETTKQLDKLTFDPDNSNLSGTERECNEDKDVEKSNNISFSRGLLDIAMELKDKRRNVKPCSGVLSVVL